MFRQLAAFVVLSLATACVAEPLDSEGETARVAESATLASPTGEEKPTRTDDLAIGKGSAPKCSCEDVGDPQPGEVCDRCEVIQGACWCFYHLKAPSSGD